ncbi:MAG: hypothetical protein Fues2KO_19700 [Fuerstiella sp.]
MPATSTIKQIYLNYGPRNGFVWRGLAVLLSVIGAAFAEDSTHAEAAADVDVERPLVLASVQGNTVRSVTGRKLSFGRDRDIRRVWVGILTDPTGGPAREIAVARHRFQLRSWRVDAVPDVCSCDERHLRQLHATVDRPRYFDIVIFQQSNRGRLSVVIDRDLDGSLDDEDIRCIPSDESIVGPDRWPPQQLMVKWRGGSLQIVSAKQQPLTAEEASPGHRRAVSRDSGAVNQTAVEVQKKNSSAETGRWLSVDRAGKWADDIQRLRELDDPDVRKQQLPKIVAEATQMINQLDGANDSERPFLIETLYRRGRALGYQELPDVLARFPVQDPADLQRRFEANFRQLQQLVDTTEADFVLLNVRRERRRGCPGAALQLVEHYRRNHPNPVWYHKKRFDLLHEFADNLAIHQAAADLWLHGEQPVPWKPPKHLFE